MGSTNMANRKTRPTRVADAETPAFPSPTAASGTDDQPATTGRTIIIFKEGASDAAGIRSTLANAAGLRHVAAASDYLEEGAATADVDDGQALHFTELGIVLVAGDEDVGALASVASDADSPILTMEPEYIAYLSDGAGLSPEYMRGYRDAVNHLYGQSGRGAETAEDEAEIAAALQDSAQFTWGLQATRVHTSRFSGRGVRVAVLDTGLDLRHPDFQNRAITHRSFVAGVPTVQDVHGHGTHCIGTACGAQRPATGVRRYGVAYGAHIFAGKVFNNNPRPGAATGDVIAGIEWAMANECRVVSLSLGVPVNQQIQQYATPLRRALNAGTLVVAAAGNNAARPGNPGFVEPPANADAAMAVAALDSSLQIAPFSARSSRITGVGGTVNIAGPGVAVFSSVPGGTHASFNGTSMATPHVAGIAALWAESRREAGAALWGRLLQTARSLTIPSADAGAGLVQAPQ
jgi:subtilisin family serine protease